MNVDAVANNALVAANHLNFLIARAGHEKCFRDKTGRLVCRPESFFHRVGRWILTGILIFFGLIFLLILCCCIKRRRSKRAKAGQVYDNPPSQFQYAPPAPPHPTYDQTNGTVPSSVPAPPVDSKPQVTGTAPTTGAAASYYNGHV